MTRTAGKHAAALTAAALSLLLLVTAASASAAWTDIPEAEITEWGELWGTEIQFQYVYDPAEGNQAESIEWDFGDGSARSTEWNPVHTYAPGTYVVVQKVTNTYDGGSEDWGYYRFTIMGRPYVEIAGPDGTSLGRIYATIGDAPVMPEDPVSGENVFVGYFVDPEYTIPFDWDAPLESGVTVYAMFEGVYVPPEEVAVDTLNITWSSVIITIAASAIISYAVWFRHPVAAAIAVILYAIAGLAIGGMINIPDIGQVIPW